MIGEVLSGFMNELKDYFIYKNRTPFSTRKFVKSYLEFFKISNLEGDKMFIEGTSN